MNRRSQAEWSALFRAQAESGVTAAAFCRAQGVDAKYFSLRRRQLLGKTVPEQTRTGPSAFVPVVVPRCSESLALELCLGPSLQLRLPSSVSASWLAELLGTLQG